MGWGYWRLRQTMVYIENVKCTSVFHWRIASLGMLQGARYCGLMGVRTRATARLYRDLVGLRSAALRVEVVLTA